MNLQSKLPDKSSNIINDIWVDNSNCDFRLYPFIKGINTQEMNIKRIFSLIDIEFDRVIISGDDKFKRQLFTGSMLDQNFLDKVKFI